MREHYFDGERCVFCRVNVYDSYIYGPEECPVEREPVVYTTETSKEPAPAPRHTGLYGEDE